MFDTVTKGYIALHPADAARTLARLDSGDSKAIFEVMPPQLAAKVLEHMAPSSAGRCLEQLTVKTAGEILARMPVTAATQTGVPPGPLRRLSIGMVNRQLVTSGLPMHLMPGVTAILMRAACSPSR